MKINSQKMCAPKFDDSEGYKRVDQYNDETTDILSVHYQKILKLMENSGRNQDN